MPTQSLYDPLSAWRTAPDAVQGDLIREATRRAGVRPNVKLRHLHDLDDYCRVEDWDELIDSYCLLSMKEDGWPRYLDRLAEMERTILRCDRRMRTGTAIRQACREITDDVLAVEDKDGTALATLSGLSLMAADRARIGQEVVRRLNASLDLHECSADESEAVDQKIMRITRSVNREIRQTRAQVDAVLRRVGGRRGPAYASREATMDDTARRRYAQAQLDQRWITDGFDKVNLGQVVRRGVRARRAQAYAMVMGMERLGDELGLVPIFVTISLPGPYHPNPTVGMPQFDPRLGPVRARQDLSLIWRDFRKGLWDCGVMPPFGLRVTESHKDGCPHGHALLWGRATEIDAIRDVLDRTCPDQAHLQGRLIRVDGCSAASYVFPYLSDAVQGLDESGLAGEAVGVDQKRLHQKQREHASVTASLADMGARRLAWIGLERGAVGVWQRVYQAAKASPQQRPVALGNMSDAMRAGAEAMTAGAWAEALRALGLVRALNPRKIVREHRIAPSGREYVGKRLVKVAGIELWRESPLIESRRKSKITKGLLDRATGEIWMPEHRTWKPCAPPDLVQGDTHEQLLPVEQGGGAHSAPDAPMETHGPPL